MVWFTLAMFVLSFALTVFFAPKPSFENARASGLDDLQFPRATAGDPIPLLLGRTRLRGPNAIWYGDFKAEAIKEKVKTGMFSSKKVTVGYKYYVGFDLGLTLGSDVKLHGMWIGKHKVIEGGTAIGPGETLFHVDRPNLFGGKKRGGGFVSNIRFYGGSFTQPRNGYLAAKADSNVPAYNGVCHVVFEQAYIGTAAQLRPIHFELSHYPNTLGLASNVNLIGQDLNPISALHYALTARWGGLSVDAGDIDTSSFTAVAATLASEGNGISLLISRANGGKGIVEEILRQIDAILYQDPQTGKIAIKLIRLDYDPLALDVFNQGNVLAVRNFSRSSWQDTINQVRVKYNSQARDYGEAISMVQDMANINAQGRLRSSTVNFPGCTDADLAITLATRELTQMSVPLYKCTLEMNRSAIALRPGDPFIFTWPEYGIDKMVMRIQRFNLGELLDGRIVVDCVQDKFATNQTVFAAPEDSLAQGPDLGAINVADAFVTEGPYWLMQQQQIVPLPPSNRTYPVVLARPGNAVQETYTATSGGATLVDQVLFPDTAKLDAPLADSDGFSSGTIASVTIRELSPTTDFLTAATVSEIRAGANLFSVNGELMAFEGVLNNGNGTWNLTSVRRALLDTAPAAHAVGDVLYFWTLDALSTEVVSDTAQFTTTIQSATSVDSEAVADALTVIHSPNRRYDRPLPPDYLTFNSSRSPAQVTTTGPHTLDWRSRSRLTDDIRFEDDTSDTEEAGVTYEVRFYLDGVLQSSKTQTGLTSPTASVTLDSPTSGTGRFEVQSKRDGLTSRTVTALELSVNIP